MTHTTLAAARALAGVGFDLPSFHLYNGLKVEVAKDALNWNQHRGVSLYSAPNILTAVLWLFERYSLWCSVDRADDGKFVWYVDDPALEVFASEGVSDFPITAYNAAIIAACDWAKQNEK